MSDLDDALKAKLGEIRDRRRRPYRGRRWIAQESRAGAAVERYFEAPAGGPPSDHLVSSATVTLAGAHDRVRLWSRGGLAGELVVTAGDGERIAEAHGLEERS